MKKQYASYKETIAFIEQCMAAHPHLIRLQTIGATWEERPIVLVIISLDVEYAQNKPALLYTGTIHAREWIGNELAIKFIDYVIKNYRFNPKLKEALTRNTLYMVPCLNPDGFEYSRNHFSFWRKNRRDNGDGTFGVDLNRNFSVKFRHSMDTGSNIYSGPHAFSEPETSAIRNFVLEHKNITIALDYHSQGNVFFPAHKFNHENEIEGTDLNVLCANMNREIFKVTGRKYGIHRGKPPANLIHGSGREYYYSHGILSTVVEVGSRNIPDYLVNMSQSVDENIPAVLHALSESINYSDLSPKRPEQFSLSSVDNNSASLSWRYQNNMEVNFEIYRAQQPKSPCCDETLVAITRDTQFTDVQLKSGQPYFYNIRAVDRVTKIKSAFSPELRIKTKLAHDEYSRSVFPSNQEVGYVGQYTLDNNKEHFGNNSLFVGVNKRKGICYGVIEFDLNNVPEDVVIKTAQFSLYPMNRVNAKVENFGEWTVSLLNAGKISDITSFTQIHNATPIQTLGQAIESEQLTQGIWSEWCFNIAERHLLKKAIKTGKVLMRIEGPRKLPLGADSQIMQFDIGYGKFGAGIHYRPNLQLIYTRVPKKVVLSPIAINTITTTEIHENKLSSGFDDHGEIIYGQMAFILSGLPEPNKTVITNAYLIMRNKTSLKTQQDTRFTIELAELKDIDFKSVKNRTKREFIGYEVSNKQLTEKDTHYFNFDSYCKNHLEKLQQDNKPCYLIIRATAASTEYDELVEWVGEGDSASPQLVIEYIERKKTMLPAPAELRTSIENGMIKLMWTNPNEEDLIGSFVVRNRFHPPKSPYDGVKLYGGADNYTYDNFANANIEKYYSVFSYDDVPNFSEPTSIHYIAREGIPVIEQEYEPQDDDDEIN
jgi:hypothetical protein